MFTGVQKHILKTAGRMRISEVAWSTKENMKEGIKVDTGNKSEELTNRWHPRKDGLPLWQNCVSPDGD